MLGVSGLLEQWYFYLGLAAASLTVYGLGREHAGRGWRWVTLKLFNSSLQATVQPVVAGVQTVEAGNAAQDARLDQMASSIEKILYELQPNGGGSIKDDVKALKGSVGELLENQKMVVLDVSTLKDQMAEHRGYHEGLSHQ